MTFKSLTPSSFPPERRERKQEYVEQTGLWLGEAVMGLLVEEERECVCLCVCDSQEAGGDSRGGGGDQEIF